MIPLNPVEIAELTSFLGYDPSIDGEWSVVPNSISCKHVINSKGTIVVRLTSVDRAGRLQKPRYCTIREYPDHYLFCALNNKEVRMHRLMARVWLDDFDDSLTVNHKDGNKHNNDYHNLEMMSVHDNCVYYHTAECISEQRKKDYAHHGDTIRGRIHITNGIEAKMIHESEGIPEGWWKGRPQSMKDKTSRSQKGHAVNNSGKRMITDGVTVRYISQNESLPEGWRLGGINQFTHEGIENLRSKMTGRLYVHKDKVNKRIYESELQHHLSSGWTRGMYSEHLDYSKPKSEEFRENMRKRMSGPGNPMYGKHLSEDHKAALSAANKGRHHSDEAKQKISQSKKGFKHTEESKQKMRDAMKGKPSSTLSTIWITDGKSNKMIKECELKQYPSYHRGITRNRR